MKLTDSFNKYNMTENCFKQKRIPQIGRNHQIAGRTNTMDFGVKDSNINAIPNKKVEINSTSRSYSHNSKERNASKNKNMQNKNIEQKYFNLEPSNII